LRKQTAEPGDDVSVDGAVQLVGMTVPAPPWQRTPRSRPVKPPLTRDAIVDAALAVLDAEGLPAMSMRRVAQELNTGAVLLVLMRQGGLSDRTAAFAVDLLSLYVTATAFEETIYLQQGLTGEAVGERFAQMHGYLESLPADLFPNVVSMVGPLLSGGGDDRFEFGLDILIQGLAASDR